MRFVCPADGRGRRFCEKQRFCLAFLLQNAENKFFSEKNFLTGTEASGLPVTLLSMEQDAGGEHT